MRAIDFEYDNQYLSDYGFIICDFNFSSGANEVDAGSTITFNKISRHGGKRYGLSSTQYDECVTTSFDICKNPDIYDPEDMEISNDEYRDIMRWLNRREFLKFQVIDDGNDNFERDTCYYNASFNVDKIKINEKLCGMRLTMETDKPFGYGQEQSVSWTFSDSNVSKILKMEIRKLLLLHMQVMIFVMILILNFLELETQSIIEIIVFLFLYLVMWSLSILPLLKIRHNYL